MKIKVLHNLFIRHNQIDFSKQSIWCIHGFADSGLAYREIFESRLCNDFNIYVVDMPGFGASPLQKEYPSIYQHAEILSKVIAEETVNQQKVNVISHSLGSLIGTWVCRNLKDSINYFFNIEGNLTEADGYFSSKPLKFKSTNHFMESFGREIFEKAILEARYKRYYSSFMLANPKGMLNWSETSQEYTRDNRCGFEFKDLTCNKIYIWGNRDTPLETQEFIEKHELPNKMYKGMGHWHMVENALEFYSDIHTLLGP
ncbi:alpha/beta fold hydrolase [Flagellimonas flava]|uniref:Pimeloyl-ACP methyl ester carboxylesterase n=1 Tax=Flagellimonas flava TaxID=570519 RepID=A0A1M5K5Y0_9FLAO|nr:alpha/beta fold hydrolase [Allomuricauda flava]SHG48195.1 Pimeloyl-ACP methyl ester carboxylesterase [Allomuricauda flava]